MRNMKKKSVRPLTKELKLDIGRKWDLRKNFGEHISVGLREIEELSRCLSEKLTRLTLKYI